MAGSLLPFDGALAQDRPSSSGGQTEEPAAEAGGDSPPGTARANDGVFGSGLQLAPISWGGSLSADWSRSSTAGQTTQFRAQTLGLNASTYVLHPAILSVSGSISLTDARSNSDFGGDTRNQGTTGALSGSGLSRTRFPFTVSYSVSDTALELVTARTNFRSRNIAYTQNYRPEEGGYSGVANINRSNVTAATGAESALTTISLGGSASFGEGHALSLNNFFADSSTADGSAASSVDSVLTHDFSLEYYYRVANTLRFSQAESTSPGNFATPARREYQAQNNVFWLPSDDYPLTLNSSIFLNRTDVGRESTSSLTGLLSAAYVFNPKLSAVVAVSGGAAEAADQATSFAAIDASATYQGDSRKLGEFNHGWGANAGAGATRSYGTGAASVGTQSLSLTQSLDRGFTLDERSELSLSVAESLGFAHSSSGTASQSSVSDSTDLSHTAQLNYSRTEGPANFRGGLQFQDSRAFRDSGDTSAQNVSANGNGQITLDRLSSVSASIGWGFSRTNSDPEWAQSGNGSVSYSRARPFGWRATSYLAQFQLNIRRTSRQQGQIVDSSDLAEPYLYAYSLEHSFTGTVGLLSGRLSNNFAWDEGGQLTWGVALRVTRQF